MTTLALNRESGLGPAWRVLKTWARRLHRVVPEDDEAAIGLLEELEQGVDDLGQQDVAVQGLAQAVADVQDDPELVGRLRLP